MGLQIYSLASGSRGNSVLLSDGRTAVLIDLGLSARELSRRLGVAGLVPGDIECVICTHEHIDHSRGIKDFCNATGRSVHIHADGAPALSAFCKIGLNEIKSFASASFEVGSMQITAVRVSHDSSCCTGFSVTAGGKKVAYFTDLGIVNEGVFEAVRGADLLFAEANHDVDMLMSGRYPYSLKRRILSPSGHLSNDACAELALFAVKNGTRKVMLGHLSENNNLPELAFSAVSGKLARERYSEGSDYILHIAQQHAPSGWIDV